MTRSEVEVGRIRIIVRMETLVKYFLKHDINNDIKLQ